MLTASSRRGNRTPELPQTPQETQTMLGFRASSSWRKQTKMFQVNSELLRKCWRPTHLHHPTLLPQTDQRMNPGWWKVDLRTMVFFFMLCNISSEVRWLDLGVGRGCHRVSFKGQAALWFPGPVGFVSTPQGFLAMAESLPLCQPQR